MGPGGAAKVAADQASEGPGVLRFAVWYVSTLQRVNKRRLKGTGQGRL